MEVWRLAVGVATGRWVALELLRRGPGVAKWRHGGLEGRCRRVASKRYGDLELGRHAVGLATWRHVEV